MADHSDILDDGEDSPQPAAPTADEATSSGVAGPGTSDLAGIPDLAGLPDMASALAGVGGAAAGGGEDVRATLGTVASGLAEQLTSITEEMNKIRAELYGDAGIGGIAKELEKLKSGGLGNLLDQGALAGALGGANGLAGLGDLGGAGAGSASSRPAAKAPARAVPKAAPAASSGSAGDGADSTEAPRRRNPPTASGVNRDAEMEALRRKLLAKRDAKEEKTRTSVSFGEKLMLLILVLVCLYIGSPFFRSTVTRAFNSMVGGGFEEEEGEEEMWD